MTLEQFTELNEQEKNHMATTNGIYIINYIQGGLQCDIFKLFDFYVRFYHEQNDEKQVIIPFARNDFILYRK